MIRNVLSIAGSDPGGGAGIQADLKTFAALGCHGMAVLNALTAQNTQRVSHVFLPPPDFVAAQIDTLFDDIRVDAVKIGMLGSADIACAVADALARHAHCPIVLDPVLIATSGDALGDDGVMRVMLEKLLPMATLITPNLAEAARLSGLPQAHDLAAMQASGEALLKAGARAVLVKGGHLADMPDRGIPARDSNGKPETTFPDRACDVLVSAAGIDLFATPRIDTRNTHGTGCTLSSAIAAHLAQGMALRDAVGAAKTYLQGALAAADALSVGEGNGPVHHFHALWQSGPADGA